MPKQLGGNVVPIGGQVLAPGIQQAQIGQQINSSLPNHTPRPTIINSAGLPTQVRPGVPQVIVPNSTGVPQPGQPQNLNATLQASQALILQQQQQLAAVQQQQLALQQQQQQQLMQQQHQTNDFDRRQNTDQKFSRSNEVNILRNLYMLIYFLLVC